MNNCLFCNSEGPFNTVEHTIPESLGNDESILKGEVCDKCQAYFGKEVESFVLNKTPFAFWRVYLGIMTKKGKNPSIDLSQPAKKKGIFPTVHPSHDNKVGFSYHNDQSVSADVDNEELIKKILSGDKSEFQFVFTPKVLHMMGRFLCKVGIELLCESNPNDARSNDLDLARNYARFGDTSNLWPIFYFKNGSLSDLKEYGKDNEGFYETVNYYSYSIAKFEEKYLLFGFSMGTDNWLISLNDPYPNPRIQQAVPGKKLDLIWYSKEEWQSVV